MGLRLGVDIACRAAHQASLADETGRLVWSGRRFHTTVADLERLWQLLPEPTDPADVTVIMEPTRNAWVPLAAWFRRRGVAVVLVPPERSADLRAYYRKHMDAAEKRCPGHGWHPLVGEHQRQLPAVVLELLQPAQPRLRRGRTDDLVVDAVPFAQLPTDGAERQRLIIDRQHTGLGMLASRPGMVRRLLVRPG